MAEAARNVACVGARAIAVTDCLNFGNPEKPEVYYQLEQCIKGMTEACNTFGIPVISGNVSLYNESMNESIYPTPVAGVLGLLEDVSLACRMGFQEPGDEVLLLGTATIRRRTGWKRVPGGYARDCCRKTIDVPGH